MIAINYYITKIKKIESDLKKMQSVRELISYIPVSSIAAVSLFLLCLWTFSPIYIMLKSILLNSHDLSDYYLNRIYLGSDWYTLLQQIGFIGCMILLFLLIKSCFLSLSDKIPTLLYSKRNLVEILLLCLLILAVFSTIASSDPLLSLRGSFYRKDGLISYIAYAGIFACGYLMDSISSIKKILMMIVLSSTFMSVLMLINIDKLNLLLNFHPNSAVFYNTNHFGYYLCIAVMSAAALFLIEEVNTKNSLYYLICFAVLVAALVKNNSFGPYIGVLVGILFLGVISFIFFKEQLTRIITVIVVFIVVCFVINIDNGFLGNELIKLSKDVQSIVNNTVTADKAGSGRWILWTEGVKYIFEKPLLGYGPENLGARYMLEGIEHDRPHNEFIQIAASLGIPALLFYIGALFRHFSIVVLNRNNLNITIITLNSIIFAYLISSMFGNTMFYTSPFYFMLLGMTVSNTKKWYYSDGSRCDKK
jgi:O-antigen ligase